MEPRGTILPVYFVADESASMGPHIGELNRGLLDLQDALQRDPHAASKVRFSVIGFSDEAFTYLEPADLRMAPQLPELTAQASTSYCAAFEELIYRISVDIPRLIDLYQHGRLKLEELITKRYALSEVNEAIESMERGEALRNVILF